MRLFLSVLLLALTAACSSTAPKGMGSINERTNILAPMSGGGRGVASEEEGESQKKKGKGSCSKCSKCGKHKHGHAH